MRVKSLFSLFLEIGKLLSISITLEVEEDAKPIKVLTLQDSIIGLERLSSAT